YMPPEQANGKMSEVDERSDIFSLGAILYQMLTLEAPYAAQNVEGTLRKAAMWELVAPRRRAPRRQIPKEVDAIVMKAMAQDPRDRYHDVAALQADLRAWQANATVSAYRDNVLGRAMKWARRHPTTAIAGSVGTVLASVSLLVISVLAGQASEARALAAAEGQAAAVAREESLRAMAREGKTSQLLLELGGKLKHEWEDARNDFYKRRMAAQKAGTSDETFVHGLAQADVGTYTSAFERMLAAHTEKPEAIPVKPEDYHFLGLLYHVGNGDAKRAIGLYTNAIELNPKYAQAYLVRGWLQMQDRKWQDAVDDFDALLRIGTPFRHEEASAYLGRGLARFLLDDRKRAIADLRKGTELNPQELPPDFVTYIEPLEDNQVFTTIARCNAAVAEDEKRWAAWVVLGVVYAQAGQQALAKEAFDKAEKWCDSGIKYFLGSFRQVFEKR
ncbi:MAG: tetratricopeptide repeat protein, partial [Planctomycetota bacterium]